LQVPVGLHPHPKLSSANYHRQASSPPHGTVASRIQAFQDVQGLHSPKPAGGFKNSAPAAGGDVLDRRARRANTTPLAPAFLPSIEEQQSNPQDALPKSDLVRHKSVTTNNADKKYLHGGLPTRPATSFDSILPHRRYKAPSISARSPERRATQRRQSSLDAQSTTHTRLSEARAKLKSIADGTAGNSAVRPTDMTTSPVRQTTGIHQLQDLIDNAICEQTDLELLAASAKASPRLKSIASQVELRMTSPSKRQSIDTESSGSPMRRGRSTRSSDRSTMPVHLPTSLGSTDGEHSSLPSSQQTSPTRKQRLSTETILPRSSTESEPLIIIAHPPISSSPEKTTRQLHPIKTFGQVTSPVKERTAAFEKMMQHDKQIMYEQANGHAGTARVKKHWWLESEDQRPSHMEGLIKQDSDVAANMTNRKSDRHHLTSARAMTATPKSGPIPLALPQLISSRGRTVSASSQFEDCFETAPQSEAALSRLSSRAHSQRTMPKATGTADIRNETISPFFRWKPFMLEKRLPAHMKTSTSPESTIEGNSGSNVPGQAGGSTSHVQFPAKIPTHAVSQDVISHCQQDRNPIKAVVQTRDSTSESTIRRPYQESDHPQALTPKRLTFRNTISTQQDRVFGDGSTGSPPKNQADYADKHPKVFQTEECDKSNHQGLDDEKELAITQGDGSPDEHDSAATEFRIKAPPSPPRSKDVMPFPMMPVKESKSASASSSGSPIRGRTGSRTFHRQSTVMGEQGHENGVRVSRSGSKAGNVRVTVEVRTPQGSPSKDKGRPDQVGNGTPMGERVVIVTTDVQAEAEEEK
jgi:hypothetical protein